MHVSWSAAKPGRCDTVKASCAAYHTLEAAYSRSASVDEELAGIHVNGSSCRASADHAAARATEACGMIADVEQWTQEPITTGNIAQDADQLVDSEEAEARFNL